MKNTTLSSFVASVAATALLSASAFGADTKTAAPAAPSADAPKAGFCASACKGKSDCGGQAMGESHGCKGQNACKGKGWITAADAKECKTKGGMWKTKKG
jgi:hypothetical protein